MLMCEEYKSEPFQCSFRFSQHTDYIHIPFITIYWLMHSFCICSYSDFYNTLCSCCPVLTRQSVPYFWRKQSWIAGRSYSFGEGATEFDLRLYISDASFCIRIHLCKSFTFSLFVWLFVCLCI